jgi:hypothetical protein
MANTTDVAQPTDDPGTEQPTSPRHQSSRLNHALAWVGIVAGGLFIVAAIFFSGFFLCWSEMGMGHMAMGHDSMAMGHMAMGHDSMDCCSDMKPGDHMMKPGAMMGPGMMGPHSGH